MTTHELIMAARRNVRRDLAAERRRCAKQVPMMREIAAHGKTSEERSLARRWLELEAAAN